MPKRVPLSQACFRGELLRGQLRRSPEAAGGGRKSIGVEKYHGDGLRFFWEFTMEDHYSHHVFHRETIYKAAVFNSYVKLPKGKWLKLR